MNVPQKSKYTRNSTFQMIAVTIQLAKYLLRANRRTAEKSSEARMITEKSQKEAAAIELEDSEKPALSSKLEAQATPKGDVSYSYWAANEVKGAAPPLEPKVTSLSIRSLFCCELCRPSAETLLFFGSFCRSSPRRRQKSSKTSPAAQGRLGTLLGPLRSAIYPTGWRTPCVSCWWALSAEVRCLWPYRR